MPCRFLSFCCRGFCLHPSSSRLRFTRGASPLATRAGYLAQIWVYLGVKTCEVFLCLVAIVKVRFIMLTSLFSFFYVTGECHRFLHRG